MTSVSTFHNLFVTSANAALNLQRDDGSFPSGENGLYRDSSTPVRTTANWALALAKAYDITKNEQFSDGANRAIEYLLHKKRRPYGYTYFCRDVEGKDSCNGLVGQALVIQTFAVAADLLGRDDLIEPAQSLYELHPFNNHANLWHRVEITGETLTIDRTLNHQLLFAAAASKLHNHEVDLSTVHQFLDSLPENIDTHQDGLLRHLVRPPRSCLIRPHFIFGKNGAEFIANELMHILRARMNSMRSKEIRYHSLNLYALTHLYQIYPSHSIWNNDKIKNIFKYIDTDSYEREIKLNKHAYKNMNTGIHNAFTVQKSMADYEKTDKEWLNTHINKTYDAQTGFFNRDSVDPISKASTIALGYDLNDVRLNNQNI